MLESRTSQRAPSVVAERPFICVDRVAKTYTTMSGTGIHAVEEVSFDVARGEFVSIVGPSGCGKSTLLKMLGGLVSLSRGDIAYAEHPSGKNRPLLGMVFQDAVLLPWRSVIENVLLPVEVQKLDASEGEARARELLSLVGLKGFEDKYPTELSGGMQQRASIARALVNEPSLLLMDEPFGALDALTREQMAQELQRIWSATQKTALFVTHSIEESVFLSDRVMVMSRRPARIAEIIHIDLPRPRTWEMIADPRFTGYSTRIRALLQTGVH
jgi:NitT/TauT family transport system ATP-binding protein